MDNNDRSFLGMGWNFPPTFRREWYSVEMLVEEDDVRSSMRIILSTITGERVMLPTFGANLHPFVFNTMNVQDIALIEEIVKEALVFHAPRIIIFDYQAGRSGRHAQNFLQNWRGHLLVDDYGGYKPLFSSASRCTELGCWAYARRKFFDLHQANNSPMAMEALQRIGVLFAIEAEGKPLTIEDRQQLRAKKKPTRTQCTA